MNEPQNQSTEDDIQEAAGKITQIAETLLLPLERAMSEIDGSDDFKTVLWEAIAVMAASRAKDHMS